MALSAQAPAGSPIIQSGTDATSYATASWTPAADRLIVVCVENSFGAGAPNTPTISGNSMTWSEVVNYQPDTSGTQYRLTLFAAKTGSSPTTEATTVDLGGQLAAGCSALFVEWNGADLTGTAVQAIVQTKNGTVDSSGTDQSITLDAAIGSGNASAGYIMHQAVEATTPGSGYTEIGPAQHTGPSSSLTSIYKLAGATLVDASWTTSAGRGGIAFEVKAAGTGGATIPLYVMHRRLVRVR